jgi:hypothetical protein
MTPARSAGRQHDLLALLVYGCLGCLLFLPALRAPQTRIIGFNGDAQQTMWFLRWTPWAVTHGVDPLLTGYINVPGQVNLMWNSLAPILGIALWPVSATAGLVVAYNVLLLGEVVLSAWCAYLAIRRLVGRPLAAAVGGLMYGFSPYLLAHAHGHAKITFALLPPLLLITLHEILVVQRRRPHTMGIVLGALLATQLLVYEEGVVLALIAAVVGTAVLAVAGRSALSDRASHATRALAWSAVTFCVLAAAPLAVQLAGPDRITATVPGGNVYVTDVANLAVPTDFQLVSPHAATRVADRFSGNEVENGSYLGIPLLAIVALAAVRLRHRPVVRWALATAAFLLLLSLGPQLHVGGHVSRIPLPWRVIESTPVIGGALPVRLFVYVDLLVALLLAAVVADTLRAPRRLPRSLGVGALLALSAVALLPRLPFPSSTVPVPAFFSGSGVASVPEGSVALVAPFAHDGPSAATMLWQAESQMRFRMPEGYFIGVRANGVRADGPRPSATGTAMIDIQRGRGVPPLTPELRRRLLDELAGWQVRTVLVGPMPHRDGMVRFVSSLLKGPPRQVGGVLVWRIDPEAV